MIKISLFLLLAATVSLTNAQNREGVANSPNEICPILIGEQIPGINVKRADGIEVNLLTEVKGSPVILIIYRGGWCPYCNTHLSELYSIEKDLLELGYKIIAVSMDKPSKLKETLADSEFNYELLSDNNADAAIALGLAFEVPMDYRKMLSENGMDLHEASGHEHNILPVPAAFILDEEGIVKFSYINPNYKTRVSGTVLLEAAKAEIKN